MIGLKPEFFIANKNIPINGLIDGELLCVKGALKSTALSMITRLQMRRLKISRRLKKISL